MRRGALFGGVGAIAFSVLTFLALGMADPPGGTYSASDSVKYLEKSHRVVLLVALYLAILSLLGLIWLLAYLRGAADAAGHADGGGRAFWATALVSVASLAAGWGVVLGDGIAHGYGGKHFAVSSPVTYLASELGFVLIVVGMMLLGFALIALMLGSPTILPAWLRWLTVVAGVAGIATPAFFPVFVVLIWGIVIGVWLLAAGGRTEVTRAPPRRAEVTPVVEPGV